MIEITIPVLDEEASIEMQVRKARTYIDKHLPEFAPIWLVIADNGSRDQTSAIARRLQSDLDNIRFIQLDERGVGRALKASWQSSPADIVGYMDLDLATDLRHLRPALEVLLTDRADVVTGSRLAKGARVHGRRIVRAITSRIFNLIVRSMFSTKFSDGMCGFKFLKRDKLAHLMDRGAISDGWIFATEVLIVAEYTGLRVLDLPVEWTDDPSSKARIGKLAVEYISALRALRRKLQTESAPA